MILFEQLLDKEIERAKSNNVDLSSIREDLRDLQCIFKQTQLGIPDVTVIADHLSHLLVVPEKHSTLENESEKLLDHISIDSNFADLSEKLMILETLLSYDPVFDNFKTMPEVEIDHQKGFEIPDPSYDDDFAPDYDDTFDTPDPDYEDDFDVLKTVQQVEIPEDNVKQSHNPQKNHPVKACRSSPIETLVIATKRLMVTLNDIENLSLDLGAPLYTQLKRFENTLNYLEKSYINITDLKNNLEDTGKTKTPALIEKLENSQTQLDRVSGCKAFIENHIEKIKKIKANEGPSNVEIAPHSPRMGRSSAG
jgi:hypothetical protein